MSLLASILKKMSKYFGGITTYQKAPALRDILQSLVDHGYAGSEYIWHIADDNAGAKYFSEEKKVEMPSAVEIYNEFKPKFHKLILQHGKTPRLGIGANKNRNIHYFLNHTKAQHCMLVDDDIIFINGGFFEELEEVLKANTNEGPGAKYSLNHICGYWTDYNEDYFDNTKQQMMSVSRKGWFDDFPIEALGARGCEWRKGAMGCSNFYTRKTLQDVLYFPTFSRYGFEHAIHSGMSLLRTDKRSPTLLPSYDMTHHYYIGNCVANNYFDSHLEIAKADPLYQERLNSFNFGLNTKNKDHGLNLKEEVILE